jgi:hypothetical protein
MVSAGEPETVAMLARNLTFIVCLWLLGRAIVLLAFAFSGRHGFADTFVHWDGAWYRSIAEGGYTFAPDGQKHNVAFFPLLPALSALVMRSGLSYVTAAGFINNLAMLVALAATFSFVELRAGAVSARWAVAVLALMPLSLFTIVGYSEGLYLCVSVLALLAHERVRDVATGLWGALATATRPTGIALAAALVFSGLRERRLATVVAGAASFLGVAAFAFFCWRAFGDPLAFIHSQQAWRGTFGVDWHSWWLIASTGIGGGRKLLAHVVAIAALVALVKRDRLDWISLVLGGCFVAIESWAWSNNTGIVVLFCAGTIAAIVYRERLGTAAFYYALLVFAMLLFGGTPFSADRNAYATVPFDIGLAFVAQRYPALGYPALAMMTYGLAVDAAAFARWEWVA